MEISNEQQFLNFNLVLFVPRHRFYMFHRSIAIYHTKERERGGGREKERDRAQKYQLRGSAIIFALNRTQWKRFDDNTRPREIVTAMRQSMAQIRRFIRLPSVRPQTIFTTSSLRTLIGRTLIRAIRAGFERDSVGCKSSLDTSDYWRAVTAICDAVRNDAAVPW